MKRYLTVIISSDTPEIQYGIF